MSLSDGDASDFGDAYAEDIVVSNWKRTTAQSHAFSLEPHHCMTVTHILSDDADYYIAACCVGLCSSSYCSQQSDNAHCPQGPGAAEGRAFAEWTLMNDGRAFRTATSAMDLSQRHCQNFHRHGHMVKSANKR